MTVRRPDNVDIEVFREAPTWEFFLQEKCEWNVFQILGIKEEMTMFLFHVSNIAISCIKCLNYWI